MYKKKKEERKEMRREKIIKLIIQEIVKIDTSI